MASEIAQTLAETLSPDNNRRIAAELKLANLSEYPEAGLALAQLIVARDVDVALRQHSASINLRKYVKERWSPYFQNFRGNAPPPEIKSQVRAAVFQGLSDSNRKIRTASAHTLSAIAECDWPDEYPELLENLIQLLSSGSSDAIHGSMQMFTDFVKSELTEDQLLPVLRRLLPILLNILGDQNHSPLTRSRTISVFRQCVESLYMVKEAHPESVKEAAATVLPVWLDAFRVLLNMDPKLDVENKPNWDGLAVRIQIVKTIDIIHTAFPRALAPYLPDFLTAALRQLCDLFPTFHQYYVLGADTVPLSSEDEKIELSQLASSTLDFIATSTRGKGKDWFNESNVHQLVGAIFNWTEMTADEESEWASDANAFVAQESEESTSYSVRVASCDLLDILVDRYPQRVLPAVQANLAAVIAQSSQANSAGNEDWWRPLEAAFTAVGAIAPTALEVLEDEKSAGRQPSLDFNQLLVSVVPGILTQSQYSFMQGRAFVLASQFSSVLPDSVAGQYIDAVISVLEAKEVTIPVKVSAIRAVQGFCKNCSDSEVFPRASRICKSIEGFIPITSSDTLTLVLDALSALLLVHRGTWLTVELADTTVSAVLNVWVKGVQDPHLMAITSALLSRLSSVPTPGVYAAVMRQTLPPLCSALARATTEGQERFYAAAALEQLCGLLQGAPSEGGVGEGFVAQLGPVLFTKIRQVQDRDAIQYAITALTLLVRKDTPQVVAWQDGAGKTGLDHILELIAWQLQSSDESGSLFIGDLIIHLMRRAGDAIVRILPELLEAMVRRMATVKTATFVQSLVIPFAFLIHTGHRDTVLNLLQGITVSVNGANKSGLEVLLQTWTENAETFQGLWASRVSTLALMDLFVASFMDGGERLRNVTVKGELVLRAETRNVIMTRSRTKQIPTEFTSEAFPIKALKLVLAELQSDGEPASLSYGGIGQRDVDHDVESDDGDEDWDEDEDDAPARPEPTGALSATEQAYVREMLGGQEVPQEVFAALSGGPGIAAGIPSFGDFDTDTDYEGDDEDLMKDPIVQVDMQAHVLSFLRDAASRNSPEFAAVVNQLKPEEVQVVQKAVGA
ncbi:ARM repeat-containing protein [Phanerochaete sordida]|uniref:ARM repeat-containing protein n=1 Tax=Phanerochaete sordida TaxID=48140 RepID=A0A9P3G7M0_9APHY|nr:ARM repeat-containing protein [Phanerochaete sordida]